jgi:predicted phage-related endonuclease
MTEPTREAWEITSIGEWLDRRRKDVTASRIAALFDLHPYMSRDGLAEIMRGDVSGGAGPIPPDSPAMRRGRILEPAVAAAVMEERPEWTLTKATTYHRLPDHRLGATPDYFVGGDGLVQCKTVSPQQFEAWHGRPPIAYTLQTLTELLVTGRAWGVLACMVCSPSYPLHLYEVPRHEAAERRLLDAVAAWWKAWDAGEIAGAVPSAAIAADLDDGSYRDLSDDNLLPLILPERAALKAEVSAAEKRLKDIDYEIKNRVGPARTAWCEGWNISFATQHRKEVLLPARDIRVLRVKPTAEEDTDADE